MSRERLPSRRRQVTDVLRYPSANGRRIHLSAGFSPDGRLLECFARGGSIVGQDLDFLLDDIAVIVSRCLQHGDRLSHIAAGLGRTREGKPTSIVAAIVDKLREIEEGDQ